MRYLIQSTVLALLVFGPLAVLGQIRPVPDNGNRKSGTSTGCLLEITVSGPTSNPAIAGDNVVAMLSATRNGPTINSECAVTSKSCLWTVTGVNYSETNDAGSFVPQPTSLVSLTYDGVEPFATMNAPDLSPGYWSVTVNASATWTIEKSAGCGDCDCGGCADANGDTTIAFAVVGVDRVIVAKSAPEIAEAATGWVGESITLEAMPKPANIVFPPGTPTWTLDAKPDGSNLTLTPGARKTTIVQPDKPGEYKVRATCGTSFKVFTLSVNDLSIVIEKCPGTFIPKGGSEDNEVIIKAKVLTAGVTGSFRFDLNNVSTEPGYCLNAPVPPPGTGEDSDSWEDLRFRDQGGYQINSNGSTATTTANNLTEATVTVSCSDYGAYGQIVATFTRNGGTGPVTAKEEGSDQKFTRIPLDDDKNHIADSAEQNSGPNNKTGATDDDDSSPTGAGNKGDRLTRYEEYRGFLVSGDHVRTDIDKKEVFYLDKSGILPQDDWTSENLTAPILKLAEGEADDDDRLVTGNSQTAKGPGQRAIFQESNPDEQLRKNFWGYASGGKHGGIPWSAKFCYVYTDALKGGLRSGSTIQVAITDVSADEIVVDVGPMIYRPLQFADPGEILIGSERIGYEQHTIVGTKLYFKRLSRGAGSTTAAAYPAGTNIQWLINPDEMAKVIVAHEAGHNVHLTHDTTDTSVMTQIKAGQTEYYHQFRHEGEKAGSTQEYRVK